MKNQMKHGKTLLAVAAVIGFAGLFSGTAMADDWHGHDHDGWHGQERQEWRAQERWEWRRDDDGYWRHVRVVEYVPYYVQAPTVVYQPAPVYVAPPPPSGFNVVIPLTIK